MVVTKPVDWLKPSNNLLTLSKSILSSFLVVTSYELFEQLRQCKKQDTDLFRNSYSDYLFSSEYLSPKVKTTETDIVK